MSAAIIGGVPRQALDWLVENGTVLVSLDVLEELADVLGRKKFDRYLPEEQRIDFLHSYLKISELVRIDEQITACRDPKDDKFLELAVNGNADYLITGDRDLLVLNPFRGIEIVTPKDFLLIG